jgi:peroxiredoxin Q/BCP
MFRWLERVGLDRPWKRCVVVLALSFPLAFALRGALIKLIPVDLAKGALAYVRKKEKQPLSEPLAQVLSDPTHRAVPTQPHPLLGRKAADFALLDHRRQEVRLTGRACAGPVVLVFYYGYHCPHCVAQLFSLNEDLRLFEELGARVLAVSADPPETTAARFQKYGPFDFSVLSDPGNRVAELYGAYRPARDGEDERLDHATFLIDADGVVFWAYRGAEPFLDSKSLLRELAGRAEAAAGAGATPPG